MMSRGKARRSFYRASLLLATASQQVLGVKLLSAAPALPEPDGPPPLPPPLHDPPAPAAGSAAPPLHGAPPAAAAPISAMSGGLSTADVVTYETRAKMSMSGGKEKPMHFLSDVLLGGVFVDTETLFARGGPRGDTPVIQIGALVADKNTPGLRLVEKEERIDGLTQKATAAEGLFKPMDVLAEGGSAHVDVTEEVASSCQDVGETAGKTARDVDSASPAAAAASGAVDMMKDVDAVPGVGAAAPPSTSSRRRTYLPWEREFDLLVVPTPRGTEYQVDIRLSIAGHQCVKERDAIILGGATLGVGGGASKITKNLFGDAHAGGEGSPPAAANPFTAPSGTDPSEAKSPLELVLERSKREEEEREKQRREELAKEKEKARLEGIIKSKASSGDAKATAKNELKDLNKAATRGYELKAKQMKASMKAKKEAEKAAKKKEAEIAAKSKAL
ncbi:unnamed protein product, partial [Amoebophrya sp. A25]|eukprot:GSA25T00020963001.1